MNEHLIRFVVEISLNGDNRWSDGHGFASTEEEAEKIATSRLRYLKSHDRIQPSPITVRVVRRQFAVAAPQDTEESA